MWFKSINKEQFTHFTLLEAKLEYAYWCSVLIEHIEDSSEIFEELNHKISRLRNNIASLISEVKEQIRSLKGIERKILSHHLTYVSIACGPHIELSERRLVARKNTAERMSTEDMMNLEVSFIKHRAELMPSEDLMAQWDRGLYLLYDYLKCAQSDLRNVNDIGLSKRIIAVEDLMSPKLTQIHSYCNSYSNHLDINWLAKIRVYSHCTHDCTALFSLGLTLAKFCGDCKTVSEALVDASHEKQRSDWQLIQKRQKTLYEALIKVNMRKSKNLIEEIGSTK
jgi:hypothetical protein